MSLGVTQLERARTSTEYRAFPPEPQGRLYEVGPRIDRCVNAVAHLARESVVHREPDTRAGHGDHNGDRHDATKTTVGSCGQRHQGCGRRQRQRDDQARLGDGGGKHRKCRVPDRMNQQHSAVGRHSADAEQREDRCKRSVIAGNEQRAPDNLTPRQRTAHAGQPRRREPHQNRTSQVGPPEFDGGCLRGGVGTSHVEEAAERHQRENRVRNVQLPVTSLRFCNAVSPGGKNPRRTQQHCWGQHSATALPDCVEVPHQRRTNCRRPQRELPESHRAEEEQDHFVTIAAALLPVNAAWSGEARRRARPALGRGWSPSGRRRASHQLHPRAMPCGVPSCS